VNFFVFKTLPLRTHTPVKQYCWFFYRSFRNSASGEKPCPIDRPTGRLWK